MNENTRKRRLPLGLITIAPLLVGFGAYSGQSGSSESGIVVRMFADTADQEVCTRRD